MIKQGILLLIKIYQILFSFDHGLLGILFPNTKYCKFIPTCSEYGYEAIEKYGIVKGSFLAIKRIIRCNPWTKKIGYDPVP